MVYTKNLILVCTGRDALRAAGDDTVKVQLKGPLNPMVISPLEGDKYTYLVLPVRLKAND